MQQYSTHRSSNAPLVLAAVGLGALLAYVLSSPRRRAALVAAGQTALDAGSRFASTSADRLHDLTEQTQDAVSRIAARARGTSDRATVTAGERFSDAVDRASDLMQQVVERARRLPGDAMRGTRESLRDLRESYDDSMHNGSRASTRGVIIAAAAVGAGLYAMQRYGASDRVRHKLGVDDSGTISLERSLFIDAPIEQVFDTWANYENFPRFMSNVRSVQPLGGDRAHWKVRGPMGVSVEFDAITRKQHPNELSWESEPGSTVHTDGRVTLVPEGSGTRATVRMSYRSAAGALGQAVSSLLGANPAREFEHDLNRMKQFIEGRRVGGAQSPV